MFDPDELYEELDHITTTEPSHCTEIPSNGFPPGHIFMLEMEDGKAVYAVMDDNNKVVLLSGEEVG